MRTTLIAVSRNDPVDCVHLFALSYFLALTRSAVDVRDGQRLLWCVEDAGAGPVFD